jgi:hypothetical protein
LPGTKLELTGNPESLYFFGIDPARNSDNLSISICKYSGDKIIPVRTISFSNTPFPEVATYIRKLLKQYSVAMIGMDAGGGGLALKDLLADPSTATSIDDIVLDIDDESTIGKKGKRILRMVDFSPGWIQEANFTLKASMEHKRLCFPDVVESDHYIRPTDNVLDENDLAAAEHIKTINELQSIVMTATKTGVLHFDTPGKHQRKDRYSALLIAHKMAYDFFVTGFQKKQLASGGVMGPNGLLVNGDEDSEFAWGQTKVIDDIKRAKAKAYGRDLIIGGSLE